MAPIGNPSRERMERQKKMRERFEAERKKAGAQKQKAVPERVKQVVEKRTKQIRGMIKDLETTRKADIIEDASAIQELITTNRLIPKERKDALLGELKKAVEARG